jgi:hypothetical protein
MRGPGFFAPIAGSKDPRTVHWFFPVTFWRPLPFWDREQDVYLREL